MKRIKRISLAASAILVGVLLPASAQGPNSQKHMRMYDPATETTLKGTIHAVTQVTHGNMNGTHITIKSGDETREVMLGPAKFIADKGFSFAKGDAIEVTGSRITMGGTEYMIAREVTKNGTKLTLRDKSGTPEWAGSGMCRGCPMRKPQ